MRLDDAEARREPKPVALLLGREERLEDPAARDFVHADTGIPHFNEHPVAGADGGAERVIPSRVHAVDIAGANRDLSGLVTKRVRGVGEQVHQNLAERGRVPQNQAPRLDLQL